MTSVAVHLRSPVGSRMASPAIRAFELARALDATLVAPAADAWVEEAVTFQRAPEDARTLAHVLERFSAVVAQQLPLATMRLLAKSPVHVVYDLYTPAVPEGLAALASCADDATQARLAAAEALLQQYALATGNAFVCTAERQRDYWLGGLGELGRLDAAVAVRRDVRQLIDVVPFGVPEQPPRPDPGVRSRLGIEPDAKILLWLGGAVPWSDPVTIVRAVARVAEDRPDVQMVLLGAEGPPGTGLAGAQAAETVAGELGVLGRSVLFLPWVPYLEREAILLEASAGVAAYHDTLEHRVAFRARLLDFIWAGLPILTTRGDVLGDLVEERGLGRALGFRDVDGWARAISELLGGVSDEFRRNVVAARDEFSWTNVVRPLRGLVDQPGAPVGRSIHTVVLELRELLTRARLSFDERGARGLVVRRIRSFRPNDEQW